MPWLARAGVQPDVAQSSAAAVVLISLTALAMILGELIPKSVALQYPTGVALATFLPMHWSLRIYAPFIKLLNGSGILLLRLVGVHNHGHRHIHSPEEIELLIAESRDGGLLEPDEQLRLHRALRLGRRTTRELMVPRARVAAIDADLPFEQIVTNLSASPYTRLPVYRGSLDHVIGMIRTKDLALHFINEGASERIGTLLRPIPRVVEDLSVDKLLPFLREQRAHQAIVVGADGRVAGLVTLQDVLASLLSPRAPRRER
jgi:CBS domain containing-hemolysin-like protein